VVALLLQLIPEGAPLALSAFGDLDEPCFFAFVGNTAQARMEVLRWLTTLRASLGATNLQGALRHCSQLSADQQTAVVQVSDGQVASSSSLLAALAGFPLSIYAIGLGTPCNRGLLGAIAQRTGGLAVFPEEKRRSTWAPALKTMLECIAHPALSGVEVRPSRAAKRGQGSVATDGVPALLAGPVAHLQ
jgi:hypothetical protein